MPRLHEGIGKGRFIPIDITTITHALPVPVFQGSNFIAKRVVLPRLHWIPLYVFVPVGESPSSLAIRMNSYRNEILCWYHVNEYRTTKGHRDQLVPASDETWNGGAPE